MNAYTLTEPLTTHKTRLRLFTLYADFPAGVRAKRLMNRVAKLAGQAWETSAEMWKLDSVAPVGSIREMIAQEAGESDVLLIAASSVTQPDPAILRWLDSLVGWKANRFPSGLLVGLPGDEEHRVEETNWIVDHLALFARRTGMEFAWQTAGRDAWEDADWLVTGLEKLLEQKRLSAA